MTKHELILDFIEQFRKLGAENCFSNGMCWHFTLILRSRVGWENQIMYDPIVNHFATEIDGHIYDITGDISQDANYHWQPWMTYSQLDSLETSRIRRDCIYKIPRDMMICSNCPHAVYTTDTGDICGLSLKPIDYYGPCQEEDKYNACSSESQMDG